MRTPKLRELIEALKVLFVQGPYTSKFPKVMTEPPETFRGKPEFDPDICIGCGACSEVCPSRSIEVIDDVETRKRTIKLHYDICNFCGQCHAYCTTKNGIDYTQEYDLASANREEMFVSVEKELVLCEMCGSVVATQDHLKWIAERLGSLAYANPTLVLAGLGEQAPGEMIPSRTADRPSSREDIFRVLCPNCRRSVYLTEEWGR